MNNHHNQAVCTISEIWPRFGARSTPGDQRQLSVESWLAIHKQLWIISVLASTNTFYENMSSCPILWKNCNGTRDHPPLGKGYATKSDEFSEKFQTAFELPLLWFFLKNIPWTLKLLLCINFMLKTPILTLPKICYINFWIENDPPALWNFSQNLSVLVALPVPW